MSDLVSVTPDEEASAMLWAYDQTDLEPVREDIRATFASGLRALTLLRRLTPNAIATALERAEGLPLAGWTDEEIRLEAAVIHSELWGILRADPQAPAADAPPAPARSQRTRRTA